MNSVMTKALDSQLHSQHSNKIRCPGEVGAYMGRALLEAREVFTETWGMKHAIGLRVLQ